MFGMGVQEFAIVAVVAILLFGKRLPEVARSFGASYRQFRQGLEYYLQAKISVQAAWLDRISAERHWASQSPEAGILLRMQQVMVEWLGHRPINRIELPQDP